MSRRTGALRRGLLIAAVASVTAVAAATVVQDAGAPEPFVPQKPEFLAIADTLRSSKNPIMGTGGRDDLLAQLAAPDLSRESYALLRCLLAIDQLRLAEIDAALETMDETIATLETDPADALLLTNAFRVRALAHLRRAEVENCVTRHNSDCCIFPLKDGGVHVVNDPARQAKADYLRYLSHPSAERSVDDVAAVSWLLNIACMALDEYPAGVPEAYRHPAKAFESEHDIGRFADVASQLGVDTFDRAGGVVVDDFDGDGLLDIVTSTCDPAGPLTAHRNVGDGTFEDVSAAWRLDDQLGGLNLIATDYDNDGRLDLFVPRGAWLLDDGRMRLSLLHQDEDGRFTDVTRRAGLGGTAAPTQTAAWADFDNDGWLDVYVGYESRAEIRNDRTSYPGQLFRNLGDGTFADVTAEAGVANDRYAKGVTAGDYDDDGDMDLFISNAGRDRLYRNDGGMHFTDVAREATVFGPPGRSFATWFFDLENDGDLDLWVGGYESTLAQVARSHAGEPGQGMPPSLYRNNGDGSFTDIAKKAGLDHAWLPMGANFGDLDNDGWLDIYLGTGDPLYETLTPNVALRNDRGLRFQDVTSSGGLGHLQKGHGVAFADLDNDGDQDIYHQLGGFLPGDAFRNALFLNPGHGRHFLTVELVGVVSNRMAVGARLTVRIATPAGPRMLHRAVGSVSSFGGSPRRQEIGLDDATAIESLEVWWPTSGQRQRFTNVSLDSFVRITEGSDELERLERAPIKMPRDG